MADKIIKTYLWITGLFTLSASLIWGINTLFLLSAGLNIFQVFLINAIFTFSMALFEIPTGVIADTVGRRISFLLSTFVLFLGTMGYVYAAELTKNLNLFIGMSIVLGVAFTFYSGAVEAWLVDALNHVGYNKDLEHVFSKGAGISSMAMLVGTLSGGFLGSLHLSIPYLVRAFTIVSAFTVAFFFMKDIGYDKKPLNAQTYIPTMQNIWNKSIEFGIKQSSIRKLMTINMFFSSFMMWGWYAWQPYFLELYGNSDAVWIAGIISALISLSMSVSSFMVPKIMSLFSKRTFYLQLIYICQTVLIFIVGYTNQFLVAVSAYIAFAFLMGLSGPVKQAYFHSLIPSEQRATVVSFDSLVGALGGAAGQPVLGYYSNEIGVGFCYRVSSILIALTVPVTYRLGHMNDPINDIKKPSND